MDLNIVVADNPVTCKYKKEAVIRDKFPQNVCNIDTKMYNTFENICN